MTNDNLPLQSEPELGTVETSNGPKAVIFQYRMYLLPSGDIQSSVSNVDPVVFMKVLAEGGIEAETQNMYAAVIRQLVRDAEMLDVNVEHLMKSM